MRPSHRIKLPANLRNTVVVAASDTAAGNSSLVALDRNGAAALELRKQLAERNMGLIDGLPPEARDVVNGLPNPVDLPSAWNDGCRSQADAEEWVRRHYGPSAVERRA